MKIRFIEFENIQYEIKSGDYIEVPQERIYGILRTHQPSFNTGDNRTLFIKNGTLFKRIPLTNKQLESIDFDDMEQTFEVSQIFSDIIYTKYYFK